MRFLSHQYMDTLNLLYNAICQGYLNKAGKKLSKKRVRFLSGPTRKPESGLYRVRGRRAGAVGGPGGRGSWSNSDGLFHSVFPLLLIPKSLQATQSVRNKWAWDEFQPSASQRLGPELLESLLYRSLPSFILGKPLRGLLIYKTGVVASLCPPQKA